MYRNILDKEVRIMKDETKVINYPYTVNCAGLFYEKLTLFVGVIGLIYIYRKCRLLSYAM